MIAKNARRPRAAGAPSAVGRHTTVLVLNVAVLPPLLCCLRCCRLLLVPGFVTRASVHAHLPSLLKQFANVEFVTVVADARVQLLKFHVSGLHVDVVTVPVDSPAAPTSEELDDVRIFDKVAAENRLSLNGIRTAVAFRRLLAPPQGRGSAAAAATADATPSFIEPDEFGIALRAVKLWAKARHVYGHNFCYPSGVGYAALLLRVAQRHARNVHNAEQLFRRFFDVIGHEWASKHPELPLVTVDSTALPPRPDLYRRWAGRPDSWDPDSMPMGAITVLTPSYPHVNSCHTACASSARVFVRELQRARAFMKRVKAETDRTYWRSLIVAETGFLDNAAGVVAVSVDSGSRELEPVNVGFLESKMKFLWYCAEAAGLDARLFPGRLPGAIGEPEAPPTTDRRRNSSSSDDEHGPGGQKQRQSAAATPPYSTTTFVLRVSGLVTSQTATPREIAAAARASIAEFRFFLEGANNMRLRTWYHAFGSAAFDAFVTATDGVAIDEESTVRPSKQHRAQE